jgi:hypothetical protein
VGGLGCSLVIAEKSKLRNTISFSVSAAIRFAHSRCVAFTAVFPLRADTAQYRFKNLQSGTSIAKSISNSGLHDFPFSFRKGEVA